MTHKQVRHLATELAGEFYEQTSSALSENDLHNDPFAFQKLRERNERSIRFRKAFPTVKAYLKGHYHKPDGKVVYTKPGWVHFVVHARAMLSQMLMRDDINDHMKNEIYEALLEEGANARRQSAHNIVQRMN